MLIGRGGGGGRGFLIRHTVLLSANCHGAVRCIVVTTPTQKPFLTTLWVYIEDWSNYVSLPEDIECNVCNFGHIFG